MQNKARAKELNNNVFHQTIEPYGEGLRFKIALTFWSLAHNVWRSNMQISGGIVVRDAQHATFRFTEHTWVR